ncbi:zinc finger protein 271-like isoform X1 [Archocentrus centrarchus]|uniref:zinc finger protein 271-like isoform X1 n=1 Tax=Archocentrus centrarchus TaxID=63155 RepID=UPI0011EA1FB1|nr:zinc finger protein 271-like isoform X1 [Archocentrus centrarchus]
MEPEVPPPWKPKREEAEENVEEPQETRVYIGAAFSRWTSLKRDKCFRSDAELACFLLDSYERGATALTAMKVKLSDAQQLLPVKEEVSWSPSLDQQHTDLTSQEGEQLNGLDEANVTRFPVSSVKSEHDDKKSASSHLHQRPTEGNSDSERLTSCSAKQIIAETDGELCGEAESARNPNPQPNADGKASDDELQKPETEDTDDGWKESRTFSSTNTYSSYSDCGEHFRYRKSLQRHVTRHLGKRTNNKCSKVRQNAVSQMASHTEEKPFGCDVCGQRFKREANLRTHIRVHTGEKPFSCKVCEKRFRHQYNLYRHMRIHTGEKPFNCSVCNKRFSQLWDLKRHENVHTGEKPFSCSICGRKFTQRMHFKRHTSVHTAERSFGCDVCGKSFKCKRGLKKHTRIHTEERPFSCDVCNKRFSQSWILKRHLSTHTGVKHLHPDEPRCVGLVTAIPAPAFSELVQIQVSSREDVQQILLEEFPSSPRLNQQDKDSHQIKAEQEELFTCQEGEHLNGLEEADITRFPVAAIQVKSEDDEEKPDSSQLHQRPTEDNSDSEPPTNCSDKQMKAETDGDDCGGPDPDRNQSSHLQPNTDGKISDSYETEVSIDDDGDDDDWQEPLTDSETEDSDNSWKDSGAFDSGVNSDGGSNFAKKYLNCSECGKQFECKQAFKRHVASSLQRRASCCFVNKKCFKVNQAADLQGGCHTEEKPFGCDICAQRFNQNAHLKTHMRIHTGEKPFCCSICEKIFRHQYNLNRHMRVHTGEKPFSCGVCGQKFNRNTNLKTHMRIHTGEKPFGCGLCSKTFSQPGDLKRHKSVHTGEKPFKCSICSKRFTQRIHYKTHMSVHTGERPFGCDLCSKTFNREGNLKIHKRVHTGEKPFGCDICGQRFNQSTNLKTHLRVHSGEKPFCCSVCGERFTREGSLRRHMRRQGINHSIDSKVE